MVDHEEGGYRTGARVEGIDCKLKGRWCRNANFKSQMLPLPHLAKNTVFGGKGKSFRLSYLLVVCSIVFFFFQKLKG